MDGFQSSDSNYRYMRNTVRPNRKIFMRTLSRLIDGLLVLILLEIFGEPDYQNWIRFYFAYSLLFSFFSGKTVGRIVCRIYIEGKTSRSWFHLAIREIIFFLLFPLIAIQALTGFRLLHDMLTKSYVEFEFK